MSQSSLLKVALLGTQRCAEFPAAPHAQLRAPWQAIAEQSERAAALLQAAALENIALRAGVRSIFVELPQEHYEAETLPYIPVAVTRAAFDLMDASFTQLLAEWITVVKASGYIVTPRLVPALLDFGRTNVNLRSIIADIIGFRGRWLGSQSDRWPWLDAALNHSLINEQWWQTGKPMQRCAWLEQQLKARPQDAAELIVESWPGDSPDIREAFTELAARYPHAAHEDWLQKRALSDRRQSTRQAATKALIQIPTSAFRQRCLQRAAALLSVESPSLGHIQLVFNPPSEFDPQWKADGIREKPPSGVGAKAYWAKQILAMIPLSEWPSLLEHEDPLSLPIEPDWSAVVLDSWKQAAISYPNVASLAPLLKRLAALDYNRERTNALQELLVVLDPNDAADLLEPLMLPDEERMVLLCELLLSLDASRHPVLHGVASEWPSTKSISKWVYIDDAIALARCCDRRAIPTLLKNMSQLPNLCASGEEFARALEYRLNYLKHFSETNEPRP